MDEQCPIVEPAPATAAGGTSAEASMCVPIDTPPESVPIGPPGSLTQPAARFPVSSGPSGRSVLRAAEGWPGFPAGPHAYP